MVSAKHGFMDKGSCQYHRNGVGRKLQRWTPEKDGPDQERVPMKVILNRNGTESTLNASAPSFTPRSGLNKLTMPSVAPAPAPAPSPQQLFITSGMQLTNMQPYKVNNVALMPPNTHFFPGVPTMPRPNTLKKKFKSLQKSFAKLLQEHSEQKLALDELHSKLAESETANECLRRQLKKMQLEKAYHDQSEDIASDAVMDTVMQESVSFDEVSSIPSCADIERQQEEEVENAVTSTQQSLSFDEVPSCVDIERQILEANGISQPSPTAPSPTPTSPNPPIERWLTLEEMHALQPKPQPQEDNAKAKIEGDATASSDLASVPETSTTAAIEADDSSPLKTNTENPSTESSQSADAPPLSQEIDNISSSTTEKEEEEPTTLPTPEMEKAEMTEEEEVGSVVVDEPNADITTSAADEDGQSTLKATENAVEASGEVEVTAKQDPNEAQAETTIEYNKDQTDGENMLPPATASEKESDDVNMTPAPEQTSVEAQDAVDNATSQPPVIPTSSDQDDNKVQTATGSADSKHPKKLPRNKQKQGRKKSKKIGDAKMRARCLQNL